MKNNKKGVFSEFTGKLGDTGFYKRVLNGREVIQRCPVKKKRKANEPLPEQNRKFRQAVLSAQIALANPEIRTVYERAATGTCSANSMYIKDFFHPAVISGVDVSGYEGQRGFRFNIRIDNIVPVKSVTVSIVSATGQVLESGQAGSVNRGDEWSYQTGSFIPDLNGAMLQVTAVDIPGHTASRNIPL